MPALHRQRFATLGPAARQNGATVLGCHAGAKAVVALALEDAGLKRSFHDINLPFDCRMNPPGAVKEAGFYRSLPSKATQKRYFPS